MRRLLCALFCSAIVAVTGCGGCSNGPPVSATGVKEVVADVKPGSDGMTNEQRNIKDRLALENDPASVKHLYVFSSMTGKCLLYSTVKGKVTSSGKRLSPTTVDGVHVDTYASQRHTVKLGGVNYITNEVIQDDGTYGSSVEYIYWFDVKGTFRQLYPPSGCMLVMSTEPLPIPQNEINVRFTKD